MIRLGLDISLHSLSRHYECGRNEAELHGLPMTSLGAGENIIIDKSTWNDSISWNFTIYQQDWRGNSDILLGQRYGNDSRI